MTGSNYVDVPFGIEGTSYVGAAGSTPTTVLGTDTKLDLNINNEVGKYATRAKKRKNAKYTTQEITASLNIVKDNSNAQFITFQAAAQSQSYIALKSIDAVGGFGIDADWAITGWKEGQPLDGADTIDVELSTNETLRALVFNNSPGTGTVIE